MHFPVQESPSCQNYLLSSDFETITENHTINDIALHRQVSDFTNYNFKVWCIP